MFNLIVGFAGGQASLERVLEYTEIPAKEWAAPRGALDPIRLRNLPTLIMPELQDASTPQIARVGHVEDVSVSGRVLRYRFVQSAAFAPFDTAHIERLASELQIDTWEFNRNHWAVKDADLYRVLQGALPSALPEPSVFRLPRHLPTEPDMVAVMMPFDAAFNPVYEALQLAVSEANMRCFRADNIWVNEHIMDDVANLLWRARVVITDLSNKNPNVFYEAGIAHTLGRNVIQISQSMSDVPFDLVSLRTILYLNNDEGRTDMRRRVAARLIDITTSS